MAARRLPDFIFDFIEGGVEDEYSVRRDRDAVASWTFKPHALADVSERSQRIELFGRTYESPFGIAPTGTGPLYYRDADVLLARAAELAKIPFVLSGGSGASLERIRKAAPTNSWYQLYGAKDRAITEHVLQRVIDAGYETVVFTADLAVTPKRERHLRSGATVPLKLNPRLLLRIARQAVLHPGWFLQYAMSGGMPLLETWQPYARAGASRMEVANFFRSQSPSSQTWKDLENVRRKFPGKVVVKGILNPADAQRAVDAGCDAVWVSTHGGKVLDRAPASMDALPLIKAQVGDRVKVFVDSGMRRGSDILVARCLGADFVFVGRATLYGVAAGGYTGVARAIEILRNEVDLVMATIGCADANKLGHEFLMDTGTLPRDARALPCDSPTMAPARLAVG